jgi:flagellar basal body-associated protein FliL
MVTGQSSKSMAFGRRRAFAAAAFAIQCVASPALAQIYSVYYRSPQPHKSELADDTVDSWISSVHDGVKKGLGAADGGLGAGLLNITFKVFEEVVKAQQSSINLENVKGLNQMRCVAVYKDMPDSDGADLTGSRAKYYKPNAHDPVFEHFFQYYWHKTFQTMKDEEKLKKIISDEGSRKMIATFVGTFEGDDGSESDGGSPRSPKSKNIEDSLLGGLQQTLKSTLKATGNDPKENLREKLREKLDPILNKKYVGLANVFRTQLGKPELSDDQAVDAHAELVQNLCGQQWIDEQGLPGHINRFAFVLPVGWTDELFSNPARDSKESAKKLPKAVTDSMGHEFEVQRDRQPWELAFDILENHGKWNRFPETTAEEKTQAYERAQNPRNYGAPQSESACSLTTMLTIGGVTTALSAAVGFLVCRGRKAAPTAPVPDTDADSQYTDGSESDEGSDASAYSECSEAAGESLNDGKGEATDAYMCGMGQAAFFLVVIVGLLAVVAGIAITVLVVCRKPAETTETNAEASDLEGAETNAFEEESVYETSAILQGTDFERAKLTGNDFDRAKVEGVTKARMSKLSNHSGEV